MNLKNILRGPCFLSKCDILTKKGSRPVQKIWKHPDEVITR
jgi:hypothetical protein